MSIKGSSYQNFQRALQTGNPLLVRAAAAELGRLSVADALSVLLVIRAADPDRYGRWAARWHAKLVTETAGLGLEGSAVALSALIAMAGDDRHGGAGALAETLEACGQAEAARRLDLLLGG